LRALHAERGANAGAKLGDGERLRHVVDGAEVEAVHLRRDVARAGEEDDRDVASELVFLQAPAEIEAGVVGELDVEQDDVREMVLRGLEAFVERLRGEEGDVLRTEVEREEVEDRRSGVGGWDLW